METTKNQKDAALLFQDKTDEIYNSSIEFDVLQRIKSFGETGVMFNGVLDEEWSVESLSIILDLLESNDIKYILIYEEEIDTPGNEWEIIIK
jgi:hypothetical protein